MKTNGQTFDGLSALNTTARSFMSTKEKTNLLNTTIRTTPRLCDPPSLEQPPPKSPQKLTRRDILLKRIAKADQSNNRTLVDMFNAKRALTPQNDYLQYSDIKPTTRSRMRDSSRDFRMAESKTRTEIVKRHDFLVAAHRRACLQT